MHTMTLLLLFIFQAPNAPAVSWTAAPIANTNGSTSSGVVPSCPSGYSVWKIPAPAPTQAQGAIPPTPRIGRTAPVKVGLSKPVPSADPTYMCRIGN